MSDLEDGWARIDPPENVTLTFCIRWPDQPEWPEGYEGIPVKFWV